MASMRDIAKLAGVSVASVSRILNNDETFSINEHTRQRVIEIANQMNYSKENGWYYINGNNKSPSWTGVEFLYDFLISNKGAGPRGEETTIDKLDIGDVIQLSFDGIRFSHGLVVVQNGDSIYNTFVAAHTYDVFGKMVGDYGFEKYRCIHLI